MARARKDYFFVDYPRNSEARPSGVIAPVYWPLNNIQLPLRRNRLRRESYHGPFRNHSLRCLWNHSSVSSEHRCVVAYCSSRWLPTTNRDVTQPRPAAATAAKTLSGAASGGYRYTTIAIAPTGSTNPAI